jgi:Protein of unknown function (DUF1102).
MKRRHLILLLGGASSGAMSVGTGAFSSVEAERGVSVNVVEDGEAYLGLEQVNKYLPVDGGNAQTVESEEYEPNDVVRIQNQFSDPLDLTVTVESTEGVVSEDSVDIDDRLAGDGELGIGHEAFVAVNCEGSGEGHVKLFFDGEADGATVEKTRTFDVSCLDVDFNGGNGNGNGNGNNGGGTVHISGFSGTLDVIVNGESPAETIQSDGDRPYVFPPNEGRIHSVTIDGSRYQRDGSTGNSGDN